MWSGRVSCLAEVFFEPVAHILDELPVREDVAVRIEAQEIPAGLDGDDGAG